MKTEIRAIKIIFLTLIFGTFGVLFYFNNPRLIDGYLAGKFRNDEVKRWGADYLYPNPQLTPGKADTLNREDLIKKYPCPENEKKVECSYSKTHRKVSDVDRMQIYIRYGINPKKVKQGEYQVDHFIPKALGGSDEKINLWMQPAHIYWKNKDYGYYTKDRLENFLVIQMKKGLMTPKETHNCLINDWIKCYNEKMVNSNLGSISLDEDMAKENEEEKQ